MPATVAVVLNAHRAGVAPLEPGRLAPRAAHGHAGPEAPPPQRPLTRTEPGRLAPRAAHGHTGPEAPPPQRPRTHPEPGRLAPRAAHGHAGPEAPPPRRPRTRTEPGRLAPRFEQEPAGKSAGWPALFTFYRIEQRLNRLLASIQNKLPVFSTGPGNQTSLPKPPMLNKRCQDADKIPGDPVALQIEALTLPRWQQR